MAVLGYEIEDSRSNEEISDSERVVQLYYSSRNWRQDSEDFWDENSINDWYKKARYYIDRQ